MIDILQPSSLAEGEGTISYSYPVVDGDKNNAENSSNIVTERNKAYGSKMALCEEVLEKNDYTQIITDYETSKGLQSENHCQQAKPTSDKWNEAKIAWNITKLMMLSPHKTILCMNHLIQWVTLEWANHDY